ncbi:hypothetical protein, partial [Acidaminococcus intestini]|uniref:hypothetical protein n=1 Tax=Acidaminococcus intestini TaxID=187327 RepID=UPI00307930FF
MDFIAKAKAAFGKVHLCILLLHLYPFCPFDALHPITYFLHFFTLSSKKENAKNLTDLKCTLFTGHPVRRVHFA